MKSMLMCVMVCLLAGAVRAEDLPVFEGLMEPREVIEFGSQAPGILDKVTVERGDMVKAGQVVARLRSGVENAALRSAEARVAFGTRKAKRNVELEKKRLISVHEKDEIETEVELARLQVAEARAQLELRTIRSTIDGVVVKRSGGPGAYVGEESFLTVAQINPLNVEVVIPVSYFGTIHVGDTARVLPDEPVGGEYEARVVVVDRVLDAASGTFGVRLELPNPKLKLPAGMKCRVTFGQGS